jgi:hypothetical protein
MGPGKDPDTGQFRAKTPETAERVAWVSGTDAFGWKIESAADIDQARREMEFDALNQRSTTKKCEQDCVHIVLAWERGETPLSICRVIALRRGPLCRSKRWRCAGHAEPDGSP